MPGLLLGIVLSFIIIIITKFTAVKVSRQCPLVFLVKVGGRQRKTMQKEEGR